MSRTMKEIIEEIEQHPERIIFLYRWLEETKYKWKEREDLCKYLLENYEKLKKQIKVVAYAGEKSNDSKGWEYKDYRSDDRDGFPQNGQSESTKGKNKPSTGEEYLAMDIFRLGRDEDNRLKYIIGLGYILDYQMPIGGTKTLLLVKDNSIYDKNNNDYEYGIIDPDKPDDQKRTKKDRLFAPGKCDLIAFDNGHFIIYELKKQNNPESMLRAVMEAYTYRQMLDIERATSSFRKHYNDLIPGGIPEGKIPWEARLLLCEKKVQYDEYIKREDSYLRQLMKKLEITPVWYTTEFSICI